MRRFLIAIILFIVMAGVLEARQRQYGVGFSIGGGFLTGTFEKQPDPGFGFKGFFGFGLKNNFEIYSSFGWFNRQCHLSPLPHGRLSSIRYPICGTHCGKLL